MNTKIAEGIKNQPLLKTDPELEKCLPPLDEKAYQDLRKSLTDNGYDKDYPIIVWEDHDIIVDGHHRYALCQELKIEPTVSQKSFDSIEDAILYALDHQTSRRNLDRGQLAIVGIARYGAEETIAARKRLAVESISPTSPITEVKGESAAIIAKKAGVKISDIYSVRAIRNEGIPEIETMLMKDSLSPTVARAFVHNTPKETQTEIVKTGGVDAVREHARTIGAANREKQAALKKEAKEEEEACASAEKLEFEEFTKGREELQKKHDAMAKQLAKRFGADFETQGRVCFVDHGNTFEFWCNDCQNGFDTFIGGKDTEFCPYCGLKNIRERKPDWIPGNVGEDE